MKHLKAILLSSVFCLSSCATTANFEKKANAKIGITETQLVKEEGIPTSMYENEGVRYLTYSFSKSGVIPGTPPTVNTTMIGGKPYTTTSGGTQPIGYTNTCTVTFKVENKVVTSYQYKGNSCRAYD